MSWTDSLWTVLPSECRVGELQRSKRCKQTVGRFQRVKRGDCLGVFWQWFWHVVVPVMVRKWGSGCDFLVNVPLFTSRVGWRGAINLHFWESHWILLDLVRPTRVQGKRDQKVFYKREKCFHIQLSHNTIMWVVPWEDTNGAYWKHTSVLCMFPW